MQEGSDIIMSDSKNAYSNASKKFTNKTVLSSEKAKHQYDVSKKKEEKYNDKWSNHMVNINDIVNQFTPNANEYVNGYKYVYENDRYQVVADMAAGYLRIKNKNTNQYVKLDGKPGSNGETHFKIKKRSEM
jgi:hypothetical protein